MCVFVGKWQLTFSFSRGMVTSIIRALLFFSTQFDEDRTCESPLYVLWLRSRLLTYGDECPK